MSEETYQYITLISFKGSLSPGEEGSLCFGERGHFQLAKGTFLSWPDRVILVCFIHLAELLDKLAGKIGANAIHRYLPAEHYWPERSVKPAASLKETPSTKWRTDRPRPLRLLQRPERVEVMALLPDYPPKVFTYKGKRHIIEKADGPERIEREWWQDKGLHRDYYAVEDTNGQRYWLFRSGHYDAAPQWYLHGFFA